ncbi:uncharacterized protein LOC108632296 [Ceratina calcarata]|uniref:Uncharacterized protein LOC108632296 n=1 Tax=Ceratina calcarata TaxID=156304 RepID=A0AAJ7JFF3_9HYME|nr:uncharacterized protein LOC108632296 [Ceratina calcarata]
MKFAVMLLETLVVISPLCAFRLPTTGNGALANELQDFFDLLPLEKIIAVTKAYHVQDKQFQAMLSLVQSNEGKLFVQDVEADPACKKLLNYMQDNGLDIYYLLNKLNESLDIPHIQPRSVTEITGGIIGYLEDVAALIPLGEFTKVYEDKRKHSKVFNDYAKTFLSEENIKFYLSLHKNVHFKNVEKSAGEIGIEQAAFRQSYLFFVVISGVVGKM